MSRRRGGEGYRDDAVWWLLRSFVTGARVSPWPSVPGAGDGLVAAVRLTAVGALAGMGWGHLTGSLGVAWASGMVAGGLGVVAGWWAMGWLRLWPHRRRWVRPLEIALRGLIDWPWNLPAHKWLCVSPERAEDPEGVVVSLPAGFVGTPRDREQIEHVVREKLALGGEERTLCSWRMSSRQHKVVFKARARPPREARFSDPEVRALVERARASKPVIALGAPTLRYPVGEPIGVDLDSESPHMAVSAGTGAGKSNMLRDVAAQLMHHGAGLVICDFKRRSHRWAKGLEGVVYARSIPEIHNALLAVAREAMRRNEAADAYPADRQPRWPRLVLLLEELNSTMEALKLYWRDELGEKGTSPAIIAYWQILTMGREARVHILTAAQLLTSAAAGGPVARAQYGTIVMARFKAQGWRMLFPDIKPIPKSDNHPGRGYIVLGNTVREGQIIFMTEAECRDLAASGKLSRVPVSRSGTERVALGEETGTVPVNGDPRDPQAVPEGSNGDGGRGLVTLGQASKDNGQAIVPLKYEALRKARSRDPDFPKPVDDTGRAPMYEPEALLRWVANRETTNDTHPSGHTAGKQRPQEVNR